jgi:hypothetical protein
VLTGTALASITETDVVTGGKTIIATVTNAIWAADLSTTGILAGLSGGTSWNTNVRDVLAYAMLTRDTDHQATLVLPAAPSYDISTTDTVTWTFPDSSYTTS